MLMIKKRRDLERLWPEWDDETSDNYREYGEWTISFPLSLH